MKRLTDRLIVWPLIVGTATAVMFTVPMLLVSLIDNPDGYVPGSQASPFLLSNLIVGLIASLIYATVCLTVIGMMIVLPLQIFEFARSCFRKDSKENRYGDLIAEIDDMTKPGGFQYESTRAMGIFAVLFYVTCVLGTLGLITVDHYFHVPHFSYEMFDLSIRPFVNVILSMVLAFIWSVCERVQLFPKWFIEG